ncbi:uncharacterized protein LOC142328025 [Lycorma delicatula]|uniref:uncharacterized protein LOC142328025 n=1 Tax=Lycorma delicatula TaxID=130591 RepID=UPI003F512BDE
MGCGASKATSVAPADSNFPIPKTNNPNNSATHVSPLSSGNMSDDEISISARASQGLAFEVPLHDDSEDNNSSSLIKKHPPKRLQRLEDQQITPLTHELLDEKQAEAEQRRQQILSQRVQSAKARQKLKRNLMNNGEVNGNGLFIESMHHEPSSIEI